MNKVQQQASGIVCPDCGGGMRVANSVPKPAEHKHCRYRRCVDCDTRVFTEEVIVRRVSERVQQDTVDKTKGKGKKLKKLKKKGKKNKKK